MSHFRTGALVIVLLLSTFSAAAQPPGTAEEGIEALRGLLDQEESRRADELARELVGRFPNHPRLRAWALIANSERTSEDAARAEAECLAAAHAEEPWYAFAVASLAFGRHLGVQTALTFSERALALAPDDPEVIALRARVLRWFEERDHEALPFLESKKVIVEAHPRLLCSRGRIYALKARTEKSGAEVSRRQALEDFASARALDPGLLCGYLSAVEMLVREKAGAEALPLIEQAIRIAPRAPAVRIAEWRALQVSGIEGAKKSAELIDRLIADPKSSVDLLGGIYMMAFEDGDTSEKKKQLETRILALDPGGRQEEWVLISRLRDMQEIDPRDRQKVMKFRRLNREFLARPQHHLDGLSSEIWMNLFFSCRDDRSVPDDELAEIVRSLAETTTNNWHISHLQGPIALADRGTHLELAESIARSASALAEKDLSDWDGEGRDAAEQWMRGGVQHSLGRVLIAKGDLAGAERELLAARKALPARPEVAYHLGLLREKQGRPTEALYLYEEGFALPHVGENPNRGALEAFYAEEHGTTRGFAAYLGKLEASQRPARKKKILAGRIGKPEPQSPFVLKTLEGTPVALKDLRGKVVVLNLWGIWCGWCVKEMPDYQRLYEKYRRDPGVRILSVNNDQSPSKVREWMQKNKYTFPVLIDDGYLAKAGVFGFPTSWFLDREGRIAFNVEGWTKELVEEYSWRIEALR